MASVASRAPALRSRRGRTRSPRLGPNRFGTAGALPAAGGSAPARDTSRCRPGRRPASARNCRRTPSRPYSASSATVTESCATPGRPARVAAAAVHRKQQWLFRGDRPIAPSTHYGADVWMRAATDRAAATNGLDRVACTLRPGRIISKQQRAAKSFRELWGTPAGRLRIQV